MSSMAFEGEVECDGVEICGNKEEALVTSVPKEESVSPVLEQLCGILWALEGLRLVLVGKDGQIGKSVIFN